MIYIAETTLKFDMREKTPALPPYIASYSSMWDIERSWVDQGCVQRAPAWHTDADMQDGKIGAMLIGAYPIGTELLVNGTIYTLEPRVTYLISMATCHRGPRHKVAQERTFWRMIYRDQSKPFTKEICTTEVIKKNMSIIQKGTWLNCFEEGKSHFDFNDKLNPKGPYSISKLLYR